MVGKNTIIGIALVAGILFLISGILFMSIIPRTAAKRPGAFERGDGPKILSGIWTASIINFICFGLCLGGVYLSQKEQRIKAAGKVLVSAGLISLLTIAFVKIGIIESIVFYLGVVLAILGGLIAFGHKTQS